MVSAGPVAQLSEMFLRDQAHGGPSGQLSTVAELLAGFVAAATTSIDIAIYDFRLSDAEAVSTVVGALTAAADRGVSVRIGYDAGKPADGTAADFARLEADPAPAGTAQWVAEHFAGTGVQVRPITAGSHLMHSKYVVRDAPVAGTSADPAGSSAVWTGSTNFTDDAWTRQENNIITVADAAMAAAYTVDFDEMWISGSSSGAGKGDAGSSMVDAGTVGWDFSPGDGPSIDAALAARIGAATDRIVIAAMVLTSHACLNALAAAIDRGVPVSGIYDSGQMDPIVRQWRQSGSAVLGDWTKVSAELAHKASTPYSPTSVHNFMHLKVMIIDDTVVTGSYNFSANAERNAENQIHCDDPTTVAAYAAFLEAVSAAFPGPSSGA